MHPVAQTHELPDFAVEISRLCARIYNEQASVTSDPDLLASTASTLLQGVYDGYGSNFISTDWNTPDHEMLTRLAQNVFSFSAARNYQQLRTITDALLDQEGNLRTFADFKEQVAAINHKFNGAWLQTEYDTCIATATQSARWQQFKSQQSLFPYLRYQTAGDEAVRSDHRLLDGITRHIDDPFWNTCYPPNGWNCRCEVIQVPDDEAADTPADTFTIPVIDPLFRTNCGRTGLIFPQGHPYYNGVPNAQIRQAIAYLPPQNGYIDYTMPGKTRTVSIHQHIMHGASELQGNLDVLSRLLQINPDIAEVTLLPEIHPKDADLKAKFYPRGWQFHDKSKNADAIITFTNKDQWVVDFKNLVGKGKHIAQHLQKASQQADYGIIKISQYQEEGIKGIKKVLTNKLKSTSLKGVIIISSDGDLLIEQYKNTIGD